MDEKGLILKFQKNEITEHHIYKYLAKNDKKHKKILEKMSREEKKHYNMWKKYTKKDVEPDRTKILLYKLFYKLFGQLFVVSLMESGEEHTKEIYSKVVKKYPEAKDIIKEENDHEDMLVSVIRKAQKHRLDSVVLGLNDALVELTGALAGLTLALQNNTLIGIAGLVTGIAASMSMAASEYLSKKVEKDIDPVNAAYVTGRAYLLTVIALVFPYFILSDYFLSLISTLIIALGVIAFFNYYSSTINKTSFWDSFKEMAIISFSVAAISFVVGYVLRVSLGVGLD